MADSQLLIALVNYDKTVFMECDASLLGVGSVIYQEYEVEEKGEIKTKWHILEYASRKFNLTETHMHSYHRYQASILY